MKALAALALIALPGSAVAELSLTIPGDAQVDRIAAGYSCEGLDDIEVEYVNAGANALALVPLEGETLVFANVLAASGARYAAGPYIWWTRGRSADLYDLRQGEDAPPIATCEEAAG